METRRHGENNFFYIDSGRTDGTDYWGGNRSSSRTWSRAIGVYEGCLCHELHLRGIKFQRQVDLPVGYNGLKLDCGYRLDIVVEDAILVELKSIAQVLPIHQAQLLTYFTFKRKEGRPSHKLQRCCPQERNHKTSFVTPFSLCLRVSGVKWFCK